MLGPLGPAVHSQKDAGIVEREEVRVVRLSIVAHDRSGAPVLTVSPEDLEVTLRGTALEIAGVQPEGIDPATDSELPDVRLQIEMGTDVRTRRTTQNEPRYWLFFIDTDNDVPGKLTKLSEAIATFVTSELAPGDFAAVASYNGRLHVEQTYTSDFADAGAAIEEAYQRPRTSGLQTAQRMRSLVSRMGDCVFVPTQGDPLPDEGSFSITPDTQAANIPCLMHHAVAYIEEMRFRSGSYYRALEGGVRLAAGVPAHTTIVAVSHGVTIHPKAEYLDAMRAVFGEGQVAALDTSLPDDDSAARELHRVLGLARDEGVSLYFIDPSKPTGTVRSARQDRMFLSDANPIATAWRAPHKDLQDLSDATGGVFTADREVIPSLRGALDRERARLAVDLYVPAETPHEQLQDIRVRSRNKDKRIEIAGARLELRPAVPPELRVTGGMQLGQQKPRAGNRPGKIQMFLIGVRQADMDYEKVGPDMVADLSLSVRVETDDGRHLVDSPHVFRHSYPVDKWEANGDATLAVRGFLEAPPGDYRLVAEFRNTRTRKTGLIVQEIHIP
jgi:VWFA-related protein